MTYLTNSQIRGIIDECIRGPHAERNRAILKRRIIDGVLLEPLAEEFDISVRQCKRIIHNGMQSIAKYT